METTVNFEFEELVPVINNTVVRGMMLYGTATLESADPSEAHAYYVSHVVLDGGLVLTPSGGVPRGHASITADLFKAVADILQNDKHDLGKAAQVAFSEAVDEEGFDRRQYSSLRVRDEMFRPRPGLGALLDAGNAA